jgi:hypothetical protein
MAECDLAHIGDVQKRIKSDFRIMGFLLQQKRPRDSVADKRFLSRRCPYYLPFLPAFMHTIPKNRGIINEIIPSWCGF